ncbi:hypothetical protein B0A52_07843 [Exophiala mesophila]|uniref:SCP domain-containing protein n=1 Tax=Exophiala mesophila TaxID=212818 RepID=A0A438MXQ2_EXOME|nr:hypothetical protein B0A52_07843 [Exophiala mesophila]
MHSVKNLSLLALAAVTAYAAPAAVDGNAIEAREPGRGYWGGGGKWYYKNGGGPPQNGGTVETVEIVTAVVTVTGYGPEPTAAPEVTSASTPPTGFSGNFRGGNSGGSPPASGGDSAPASSPAPSVGSSGSTPSVGGGGDWFSIANKWRVAIGKSAFTEDSKLVANAQDTANSSGGQLKHKLNPGSFAQVLAPGNSGNFESVFLGGWLCERPSLPGLNGVCASASQGWNHAGQTGHADIINGGYSKIGCALGQGIWACDFA